MGDCGYEKAYNSSTMKNADIKSTALGFAREHKSKIAESLTDVKMFPPNEMPISVFMAGSPGAGKTEFSKRLVEAFGKKKPKAIRIDGDELRAFFPDYKGNNSKLFQGGRKY